jgi:hypothetical protein
MSSIFSEILQLLKSAEQRGIPPEQVTFSLSQRGMQRFRAASVRVPGADRVLSRLIVTYNPEQKTDVDLGPLLN